MMLRRYSHSSLNFAFADPTDVCLVEPCFYSHDSACHYTYTLVGKTAEFMSQTTSCELALKCAFPAAGNDLEQQWRRLSRMTSLL